MIRSTSAFLALLFLPALLATAQAEAGATPADPMQQVRQLREEADTVRGAAEAEHQAAQTSCWKSFLVSACLEDAATRLRQETNRARELDRQAREIERNEKKRQFAEREARRQEEAPAREAAAAARAEENRREAEEAQARVARKQAEAAERP